jgi:imidazole glycerol-phosphate synthase subunit HisF
MRTGLNPRIIPVLLLQEGRLVKGVNFQQHTYVGDPINAVRIFNAKRADELFLLDIAATRRGTIPSPDFVQRVADECYMPFGVGGGIRTVAEMRQLLRAGAEKVSINTAAVETPGLIREASEVFGSSSITVAIDVKRDGQGKEWVYTHAGTRQTDLEPVAWAVQAAEQGAGEIFLTSIDRDGTFGGYDLELVKRVTRAVDIPVIACGGAGREEDLYQVIDTAGAAAAAAGSLFVFYGPHKSVLIQYPAQGGSGLIARRQAGTL